MHNQRGKIIRHGRSKRKRTTNHFGVETDQAKQQDSAEPLHEICLQRQPWPDIRNSFRRPDRQFGERYWQQPSALLRGNRISGKGYLRLGWWTDRTGRKVIEENRLYDYIILFAWLFLHLCVNLHISVERLSMEKKEYENRILVILTDKMITNTYLTEQLGISKTAVSRRCASTTHPSAPQSTEISQVPQCDPKDLYETVE